MSTPPVSPPIHLNQLVKDNQTEYTVVADLEEKEEGWYEAWLITDEGAISMGKLRSAKGGYVSDFSTDLDKSQVDKFVISYETVPTDQPTQVVLEKEVQNEEE